MDANDPEYLRGRINALEQLIVAIMENLYDQTIISGAREELEEIRSSYVEETNDWDRKCKVKKDDE